MGSIFTYGNTAHEREQNMTPASAPSPQNVPANRVRQPRKPTRQPVSIPGRSKQPKIEPGEHDIIGWVMIPRILHWKEELGLGCYWPIGY